jgi:hypothetical protein
VESATEQTRERSDLGWQHEATNKNSLASFLSFSFFFRVFFFFHFSYVHFLSQCRPHPRPHHSLRQASFYKLFFNLLSVFPLIFFLAHCVNVLFMLRCRDHQIFCWCYSAMVLFCCVPLRLNLLLSFTRLHLSCMFLALMAHTRLATSVASQA